MNNDQDQLRKCYCFPPASLSGDPLLKTLNISAGTRSFSFVLTHLATFAIARNNKCTRLTMAFPTHRVTLEADSKTGDVFQDVATGSYDLVQEQPESLEFSPPEAQADNIDRATRVLEVTKITVARRPEYVY